MIILIPISIGFYFNVVIHDKYLELKEGDIPEFADMIKETDAKLLIVDSINGQYVSLVYFWDLDIDVCLINGSERISEWTGRRL